MKNSVVGVLFLSSRDRELLSNFLQAEGYQAWCPSTVEAFEEGITTHLQRLSIVIVEQGVARKLGTRLLEIRDSREIPLPIVVALKADRSVSPWLREGFDDFLRLPMETNQLRARLALTLSTHKKALRRLEARNAELEKRNRQLSKARVEAEKASLAKSEFIANISHELRTPLHGILGSVEILKVEPEESEQVELIEINGRSLLGLVSELLSYAALESGQTHVSVRSVELRKFLRATLDPVRERALELGLNFSETIDPALPEFVLTDPQRFCQIVGNLLNNAVKFTNQGSVDFRLKYQDQMVTMTFEDTGIGIPKEQRSQVFKPFHQVDASTTRSFEGAGLGLAIVQRLVRALRGEMTLQSEVGRGSVFTVTLPVAAGVAPVRSSESSAVAGQDATPLAILVVEDNPINSRVMEKLLQLWGHRPTLAHSGLQALELLQQQRFDLVLMDVQMPGLSGLETTRRWRAIEADKELAPVPIIALTARTTERDREVCLESGMNDFLEKPPDNQKLRELISDLAR